MKRAPIVGRTVNCVECGETATHWCGHVCKSDGSHVLAGWCPAHKDLDKVVGDTVPDAACHGDWTKKMGVRNPTP